MPHPSVRSARSLVAALLTVLSTGGCNIDPVDDSAVFRLTVRPEELAKWRSRLPMTATATLSGFGIGAPTTPDRRTINVTADTAFLLYDMELAGSGANFTLRVALANAAGDTVFRYPAPGESDQPFTLLNGAEVSLAVVVVDVAPVTPSRAPR